MRHLSVALLAIGLVIPASALAGTNSGNYRDGITAASAFCWPINDLAFQLSGDRDPIESDYERAREVIGSQVEAVYGAWLPTDHRKIFRLGFDKGAAECARI